MAVTFLAAALRLWGLGRESIWLDEATSLFLARMDLPALVAWTAHDIHPPLYYILLHFWLVFGTSEAALRALSAVAGVLAVPLTWILGERLWGRREGLIAALLVAVAPLHIWYSQETRMYALVALLGLAASFCFWRAIVAGGGPLWLLGYGVSLAVGLYTHYYSLFVLGGHGAFVLWLLITRPDRRNRLVRFALATAVALLAFAPWMPTVVRQVRTGGGGWVEQTIGAPGPRALLDTLIAFSLGTVPKALPALVRRTGYFLFLAAAGWAILAGVAGRGPVQVTRRRRDALVFALCISVVPVLVAWTISQVKPLFSLRYFLPFLPPFLLLVAHGLARLPGRGVWAGATVVLVALALAGTVRQAQMLQKDDWRDAAAIIADAGQPDDALLFSPGWNYKAFDYYAARRYPEIVLPVPVPATIESDLPAHLLAHERVWLLDQPNHYTDPAGRVRRWLTAHWRRVASYDIRGVGAVTLFERLP
ncbi:MAG: glycosyltransferase family 39 protein [Ardenticatenaceae bacterium]|nr:glycosyltransferase family 39 protein [Ardenticatenaceae bacterium]